ncbi:MAG: glycoside hydrolase [Anaerolineaceae bacterium]|nr:glycoside hydrolase [Anaerolineaceae bacterium]
MALKIAIIGGGSAYAPGLINAFIHHAATFAGAELALMDIAETEVGIVQRLGQRLADHAGVDMRITATTNQREAISGADYVLTTFRQGGFEARHQDEAIPLQFGVIGQETIGPGGFFFAMRTLPVIKSIVQDIEEVAPGAVLVNYTNPTQIVAEAVTHFSDIPCISICDQTRDDQGKILGALNMPDAAVELESIGLNHATWSTRFTINGEDGVAVMMRHYDKVMAREDVSNRVKRQFRLAGEYGRLPNSYLQYYYYCEETVKEAQAAPKTRAQEILEALPGYYEHFQEQIAADVPHLTHARGGSVFGDMAVEVLRGLVERDGRIHTLNIPNHRAIPGFAEDRVVEVPARLEAAGASPLVQPALPAEVMGLLHMLAEYQWTAAEAIWNDDRRAAVHALATNPLVVSLPLANRLLDAITPLQRGYFTPGLAG